MPGQPPILIEPYDPAWPEKFAAERALLEAVLAPWLAGAIEHIGSTAVPGLPAKPVIDILAPVHDLARSRPALEALRPLRYCYFPYKHDVMHWLCKPSDQERTHHLHLVPFGSRLWRERLAFRDHLRANPRSAGEYRALKERLAVEFRDDSDAYTDAKTGFILQILARCDLPSP